MKYVLMLWLTWNPSLSGAAADSSLLAIQVENLRLCRTALHLIKARAQRIDGICIEVKE